MGSIITLTTDFGISDPYIGEMKGAILGINPKATIIDLCHNIKPQNILEASFLISTAYRSFPEETIHVIVVDPGVGSGRRLVLLKTPVAFFIAPDNGVLSYVLFSNSHQVAELDLEIKEKELPAGLEAISITNSRFWRHPTSSTFHGRDIMAPVAAYLSLGTSLYEFGEVIHFLLAFTPPHPYVDSEASDGSIVGHIIHIDHFGNLITNIKSDLITEDITVEVCGRYIQGLSSCYSEASEGGELLALIGSSGNLEIAAKNKSAADMLKAEFGDKVRIRGKG
jgi:hypothetical protein